MPGSTVQGRPFSLRPDVVVTVLEDGAVVLDLESKYFYSVNSSGWSILQLFETGVSPKKVQTQCEAWGAAAGDESAIAGFIETLFGDKLIVPTEAPLPQGDVAPEGEWVTPRIEKHREPLQRVMTSAFDPSLPLAE